MSGFFSMLVKHFLGLLGNGLTFRGSVLTSRPQPLNFLRGRRECAGRRRTLFCPTRHLKGEVP